MLLSLQQLFVTWSLPASDAAALIQLSLSFSISVQKYPWLITVDICHCGDGLESFSLAHPERPQGHFPAFYPLWSFELFAGY